MARKANHELDHKRDSKLEHELQVTRYLAAAFIAQSHGIGMDYARKKYADVPVGAFWASQNPAAKHIRLVTLRSQNAAQANQS